MEVKTATKETIDLSDFLDKAQELIDEYLVIGAKRPSKAARLASTANMLVEIIEALVARHEEVFDKLEDIHHDMEASTESLGEVETKLGILEYTFDNDALDEIASSSP